MTFLVALLLGLAQGLTEFLPISSSGHLIIFAELLNHNSPGVLLEITVHLATVLAVILYFRQRFVAIIKGLRRDLSTQQLVFMLAIAFVATSALGLALSPLISASFDSPAVAGGMLLVTGAVLLSTRRLRVVEEAQTGGVAPLRMTWKVALLVGLAQGLAIFPGLSRSGMTIVAGLWGGMGRNSAAEFSFLLAVPTVLAAAAYSLLEEPSISGSDGGILLIAGITAFATGFLAIHWLMRWLQKGKLEWFGVYCALAGSLSLALWGTGVI